MITRDPLKVPCLTEGYWTTFPDLPGKRARPHFHSSAATGTAQPLPRISH